MQMEGQTFNSALAVRVHTAQASLSLHESSELPAGAAAALGVAAPWRPRNLETSHQLGAMATPLPARSGRGDWGKSGRHGASNGGPASFMLHKLHAAERSSPELGLAD